MSRITIPEMEATGHIPEPGFSKLMLLAESATMRLSVGHRKNDLTDMVTTKKGASVYLVYNAELKVIPAFGELDFTPITKSGDSYSPHLLSIKSLIKNHDV